MTTPSDAEKAPRGMLSRIVRTWALPVVLGVGIALAWMKFVTPTNGSAEFVQDLKPSAIDGDRAYGYLKEICALGPRLAGTEANTRQREMVKKHWKSLGLTIREQPFATRHPLTGKRVDMVNLIGSWKPEREERIVLAAHYDTRPFPDMERDPADRRKPFLGANDCASGVALLMEVANILKDSPSPWGIDLVLLDGEELIFEEVDENREIVRRGEFFLGSKEFGRVYKAEKKRSKTRYVAGLVFDMIGSKELSLPVEPLSQKLAGNVVRQIWGIADKLDVQAFHQNQGREALDDHLPLNDAGIPTADIIDFEYPFWHKAGDLPEECSGKSLEDVGRVVTAWLNLPKAAKGKKR